MADDSAAAESGVVVAGSLYNRGVIRAVEYSGVLSARVTLPLHDVARNCAALHVVARLQQASRLNRAIGHRRAALERARDEADGPAFYILIDSRRGDREILDTASGDGVEERRDEPFERMPVSVENTPEVNGAPRRKVDVRRKPVFRVGGRILGYGGGKLAVRTDFLHAVIAIRRIRRHQRQVGSDRRHNVILVFPKHPADEVLTLVRRKRCGRSYSSAVHYHDFVDDRHAVLVEELHAVSHRAFWRVRKREQPFRIGADVGRDNGLDGREGELTGTCEHCEVGDICGIMELVEIAGGSQIRLHVLLRL